jgi:ubiquinone/menaquinone biosynthesis C-methylase UbiE
MNHLKITQETYRQIATIYAQAQRERSHLLPHIEQFVALLPPGGLVLDVGCGPGWDTAVLQTLSLTTIGLDYSHAMMQAGKAEHGLPLHFVQADMRHLPVRGSADGIWACASLLHLARGEVLPTLHEFYRVLKPGGILYLSVKVGNQEQWVEAPYGQPLPRFYTFWQPETLDPLLETAAFQIIDGWQDEGERDRWLVRYARKKEPEA